MARRTQGADVRGDLERSKSGMAIDLPNADERLNDEAWREIDQCLADISALAGQAIRDQAFYAGALERTRWALNSPSAVVWMRDGDGRWAQSMQSGDLPERDAAHNQRVAQALARREKCVQRFASSNTSSDTLSFVAPVLVDGCVLAAIEVFPRVDLAPLAQVGQEQFLAAVADCAVEFHRNELLRQLRGREAWWRSFAEFTERIDASQELSRVASEMANGARSLLEVDRAAVVSWAGQRATMQGLSGVDAFDSRAAAVLSAEALAHAVLQVNEALWYPTDGQVLAPQVEAALARHLDASPAKALAVIPLSSDDAQPTGALLLERFAIDGSRIAWHDRWPHVARQSARALENALVWNALPLGAWSRRWALARRQSASGRLSKICVAALIVVGLFIAIGFVPADFRVPAAGELQPVGLRHIFSGAEGEVIEVLTRSGEQVQPNQVLAKLRSPKLDLELTRVLGELQTAQVRLATLESARLERRFSTAEDATKAQQLVAEEEELRESVKGFAAQKAVLDEERKLLDVRSPIAGQIVTPWDVLDAMPARPVRTGQQLFTVADSKGDWRLELRVPDRWIGHVLAERNQNQAPQVVTFIVSTDPNTQCSANVEDVALRAETGDDGSATVLVKARVAASELHAPRPGATVQSQIACGRRSLGYVWFHEIWDRAAAWWTLHT